MMNTNKCSASSSMATFLVTLALTAQNGHAFTSLSSRAPSAATATRLNVVGGSSAYLDSLGSAQPNGGNDGSSEFLVGVLGDLHIDPRKMEDYEIGRQHWQDLFAQTGPDVKTAIVSLGDLGESKSVRPEETRELFAGTTECHLMAAEYLNSIGPPYEVVGGNHDLEGIDEFKTDEENLELFLRAHNKPWPQFIRKITDKTLLVGLTSTVFRDAPYTSHEVVIDEDQINWFEDVVKSHPASEGYKIIVFTHAPPNGSGLRVLQENHVVNGCCWLNHSNENQCRKFIELVREHRCIKAWFSGHFHLGQDYQDSITFPTVPKEEGPYPNRGSCVFAQTSVMRTGTSRDGRRQSRVIRGNDDGFEICTLDHANGGALRVDASITYTDANHEVGVYTHDDLSRQGDQFFKVYAPCAGDDYHPPDENLVRYNENGELHISTPVTMDSVAWWYMDCGRVIGLLNGMMIEYDRSTLAPLGLIVGADELLGKTIAVVDSGISEEECLILQDEIGMEGADCSGEQEAREQAVLLQGPDGSVVVVQPNEDGSYWRKIVRNKMIREKEKRRELAAKALAPNGADVVSSWGPYTSTAGTAKHTAVSGLTAPALR